MSEERREKPKRRPPETTEAEAETPEKQRTCGEKDPVDEKGREREPRREESRAETSEETRDEQETGIQNVLLFVVCLWFL
jgi:hypothetical protein